MSSPTTQPETPEILVNASSPVFSALRDIITDDPHSWDTAWTQNITPWESGDIQPPLREVTQSGEVAFPTRGRAFVPGCGSGHDARYIASALGLDTLAIDISPTAVRNATKNIPDGVNARIEVQDFFSFSVPETEKFDLIYDYTSVDPLLQPKTGVDIKARFFVAIPPSRRGEWGAQMNSLIKRGGYLITLVYPIVPETDVGPPWFVRPEHYYGPLGDGWEKVVDRVPTESQPTHVGRERLVVWRKL
ncbi:S-adenosyl-L-methionine-dependent methyltransferase [Mycena pura]|uniref:S-adenosyl-L-methionine-dependent methyltransferase n=1 Tax=Mycena pura TaxID=153505 RepID=A0AAD6VA22_9AGAR|nr:S-adenosyl-L-methionine-dependent methyltransferase [Mycena pura]